MLNYKINYTLNINFYSEIRLEDLCNNKNLVLNELANRLNIEFDKNFLNYDLSKSNSGRWRKDFDKIECGLNVDPCNPKKK